MQNSGSVPYAEDRTAGINQVVPINGMFCWLEVLRNAVYMTNAVVLLGVIALQEALGRLTGARSLRGGI